MTRELTNYGDQRFQWFWNRAHDWIPDYDDGGAGMMTLQSMLMQTDGRRIQLLPAWPRDWTADFKLYAPYQTTVEGDDKAQRASGYAVYAVLGLTVAESLLLGCTTVVVEGTSD